MEVQALVLDIGQGWTRAGFAGDDAPRAMYPTTIGKAKYERSMVGIGSERSPIGDEANSKRGIMVMKTPFEDGIVNNWDAWEALVHHAFYNELRVAPEEHPVLLSAPILNPASVSEKKCQLMFETFSVPAMCLSNVGNLNAYASGRGICMNVDLGEGGMQIYPLYEGYCVVNALYRNNLGGAVLSKYFAKLISEQKIPGSVATCSANPTSAELLAMGDLRHRYCYLPLDYEQELQEFNVSNSKNVDMEMPDGRIQQLGNGRIRCPEALFKPALVGYECAGLAKQVYSSIMKCDMDLRKDLVNNIVVSGGLSLTPGLPERLQSEISKLCPASLRCRVVSPPERRYSTWIGGSILASLSTFQQQWISKEEYDERGPNTVHYHGNIALGMHLLPRY